MTICYGVLIFFPDFRFTDNVSSTSLQQKLDAGQMWSLHTSRFGPLALAKLLLLSKPRK